MVRKGISLASGVIVALTLLTGCSSQVATVVPNQGLTDIVSATDARLKSEGVTAILDDAFGGRDIFGYVANSDLYFNTFTFLKYDGIEHYHNIAYHATEKTWETVRTLLTAKEGDSVFLAFPNSDTGSGNVTGIKTTMDGNTYTRVLTFDLPGKPTSTLTVSTSDGVVTQVTVKNSWKPDSGASDGCMYFPESVYCLGRVHYAYGAYAPAKRIQHALNEYERQLPDEASKQAFEGLLHAMATSTSKAAKTGFVAISNDNESYSFNAKTRKGASLLSGIDGKTEKGSASLENIAGSVFHHIFMDPTDGSAMYLGGAISWDSTTQTFTVRGMGEDTSVIATFTVHDGLIVAATEKTYDDTVQKWTMEYRTP